MVQHAPNADEQKHAPSPNVEVLKALHEKCTKNYEGKYPSALFNITVDLDPREVAEMELLIQCAKRTAERLKEKEPRYKVLESLIEEMRAKKIPLFMLDHHIIGDEAATQVTKDLLGDAPAIRVPKKVKDLYTWEGIIADMETTLSEYRSGQARARSATKFGRQIRELYRFMKEAQPLQI